MLTEKSVVASRNMLEGASVYHPKNKKKNIRTHISFSLFLFLFNLTFSHPLFTLSRFVSPSLSPLTLF